MRRVTGFVLTLLGVFLLVVAALLKFWLAPAAAKFPLNEYQVIDLSGTGSYFSQSQIGEQTGVSVGVTFTMKGNTDLGSSNTAVWDFFTSVQDRTNHQPISYPTYREAFDRKTGELTNCCGSYVTDPLPPNAKKPSVRMSGQSVFFPMGAKQQAYTIFDTTPGKPETATFAGTASVQGITVYKYVEKVSPVRFGSYDVPGSIIGDAFDPMVALGEYYSATNTFYIDPETGAPLDISQNQTITLGNSPSNVEILASELSVVETGPSIASSVSADQHARNELSLIRVILPLTGLLVGIVALLAGIALTWLGGDRDDLDGRMMGNRELDTFA